MTFQRVCAEVDVAAGTGIPAQLKAADGAAIALAIIRDTNGDVHAISQFCTHAEVPLDEGEIDDCSVECWAHGAEFDLETGEGTLPATRPVLVYPVQVQDGHIAVDVDDVKR